MRQKIRPHDAPHPTPADPARTNPRMPLRQFRARGRPPAFLHYGQWRSRPRPIAAPPSCPLAPRHRASPRPAPESRQSRAAGRQIRATAISLAALRTVGAAPPAASARRASASAGKRIEIGLFEGQRRDAGEIEPRRRRPHAHRPGQAMRDRNAHVRRAKLGDDRAVAELDQAVDDRLRVNDHIERLRPQREQMMGLDEFEALVHQRRRIDRDLRSHGPGRMLERLLQRDLADRLERPSAKRPAGSGQDDAAHILAAAGAERLEDRVVLGIDRQAPWRRRRRRGA